MVSVIIPAFNAGRYLDEAVASVLRQTHSDLEIIVVDDGSTDDTKAVMDRYAGHSSVRYLRQQNRGPGAARNTGALIARGEYLAFLDADDAFVPDSVEARVALARSQSPRLDFVFANYLVRDGGSEHSRYGAGVPTVAAHARRVGAGIVLTGSVAELADIAFVAWTGTVLMSRALFTELGGFPVEHHVAEDRRLWARAIERTRRAGYIDRPLARYTCDRSTMTGPKAARYAASRIAVAEGMLHSYRGHRGVAATHVSATLHYELAVDYATQGHVSRALAHLSRAVMYEPSALCAWLLLAGLVTRPLRRGLRHALRFATGRRGDIAEVIAPPSADVSANVMAGWTTHGTDIHTHRATQESAPPHGTRRPMRRRDEFGQ
jgi:glycosyl transferase family 2